MKYWFFFITMICLGGCANEAAEQQKSPPPGSTALPATEAAAQGPAWLVFSRLPLVKGAEASNMCRPKFDETTPLFPVENDPNRRYFNVQSGLYAVVVSAGNSRTNFMLRANNGVLELITSEQYPECLSRKSSFHMNDTGTGFLYDAGKYAKFSMEVQKSDSGFRVDLFWDASKQFGLTVRRRLAGVEESAPQ